MDKNKIYSFCVDITVEIGSVQFDIFINHLKNVQSGFDHKQKTQILFATYLITKI